MGTYTFNGVTYDDANLTANNGRGYEAIVETGTGVFVSLYIAPMIDALADAANNLITTSVTSNDITLGSKSFVLAMDLPIFPGLLGNAIDRADPANSLAFTITAYDSGTMTVTVDVTQIAGSGSGIVDWDLAFGTGQPGATGPAGADGEDLIDKIQWHNILVVVPTADGFIINLDSPEAQTLEELVARAETATSGTVDISLQINDVETASLLAVGTSEENTTTFSDDTVAAGDKLSFVLSNVGDLTNLEVKVGFKADEII